MGNSLQDQPDGLWHHPNHNHEQVMRALEVIDANVRVTYRLLATVAAAQVTINQQEQQMALDLSAVTNAVSAEASVEASAITLLQGISAALTAAAGDPAAVQAIADQINSQASALADAVAQNTPAVAPVVPPTPVVPDPTAV